MIMSNSTQLLTLECSNKMCGAKIRIGRILNFPYRQVGTFKFCPMCGSAATSFGHDVEENYWEAMASAYNVDVSLIRQIYDTWNPSEYVKFHDYMSALRKEANIND